MPLVQYFLPWETTNNFQNFDYAGLNYDTILSFADVAGFRCGFVMNFLYLILKIARYLN